MQLMEATRSARARLRKYVSGFFRFVCAKYVMEVSLSVAWIIVLCWITFRLGEAKVYSRLKPEHLPKFMFWWQPMTFWEGVWLMAAMWWVCMVFGLTVLFYRVGSLHEEELRRLGDGDEDIDTESGTNAVLVPLMAEERGEEKV